MKSKKNVKIIEKGIKGFVKKNKIEIIEILATIVLSVIFLSTYKNMFLAFMINALLTYFFVLKTGFIRKVITK